MELGYYALHKTVYLWVGLAPRNGAIVHSMACLDGLFWLDNGRGL